MNISESKENSRILQKTLHKILTYKMMDKLDKELKEFKIPRYKVSQEAGRSHTALNKIFSEAEDIRMSTFLRYWFTINDMLRQENKPSLEFESLIDSEMEMIIQMAIIVADNGINFSIRQDPDFFSSMKVHFIQLKKSKALSVEEIHLVNQIFKLLEEETIL